MSEDAVESIDDEHAVTPLELVFDVVFLLGITQVTTLVIRSPRR